jgi:diguanylate cyclase (GGDEF)-like protein/PAS domain S-box-containing protein
MSVAVGAYYAPGFSLGSPHRMAIVLRAWRPYLVQHPLYCSIRRTTLNHPPTIGVLSPLVGGFYFGGILDGLTHAAHAAGCRVLAIQTQDAGLLHWAHVVPPPFHIPLAWQHVAGWIVILNAGNADYLQRLQGTGTPLVMVSQALPSVTCPVVFTENRIGLREAVTHLIEHGHRQIAFAGNMAQTDIQERFAAYQETLLAHHIQPDPRLVFPTDNNHETGGCRAAEQLLAAGLPSTAIVAGTDLTAIGIMKMLTAAGYSLPQDQAIVGFDDTAVALYSNPPLSSVRQRFDLLGRTAVDLLLAQLADEHVPPVHYSVPTTFVARESCGCTREAALTYVPPAKARGTDGWQAHVAQRLASVIVDHDSLKGSEPVQAVIRPMVAMLDAVLHGEALPSAASVRETWAAIYTLNPYHDTMLRVIEELRSAGRGLIIHSTTSNRDTRIHLEDFIHHATLELMQIQMQAQFTATHTVQSSLGSQSEITLKLLRSHEEDIRGLAWLQWTDASAGVLGMWNNRPTKQDDDQQLALVGAFHRDSAQLQALVGQQYALEEFPPAELLALAGADTDAVLFVIPVKLRTSNWGMLAVVGPVETRATGRETFNQCAALLSVALDHEVVLQSLREQRESLARAYQRERELVESIRVSEERYALAARAANDGLWDWNLLTNTIYYSARWKAMLGFDDDAIDPSPNEWLSRVHPDDQLRLARAIAGHRRGATPTLELEHRVRDQRGMYRWMLCRGLAVRDESQRATRVVGSLTDITDRKRLEERLLHDAWYDGLTGLPNRSLFLDRLERVITHSKRDADYRGAVLFLDLDGFKIVNDSLGHLVGNELLIGIAQRLTTSLRADDTVARFGGDEFALLLNSINDQPDLPDLIGRIQASLATPFQLLGHEVVVTASIGVATDLSTYTSAEDVLRDADIAMYRAKAAGKRTHAFFDVEMHAGAVNRLVIETELRRAIEQQEFELHYQPIVELATGRVIRFEALLRWQHPTRGLLAPAAFLPIAEETGLIIPLGRWIFWEACRQIRTWLDDELLEPTFSVSVNVAHKQFWHPELLPQILSALQANALDASILRLEITEAVIMSNPDAANRIMQQLHDQGIRLQIDDFGTGYSSLEALHHFPIEALKIDRSFVARLGVDRRSTELVRTIIMMGHNLGMDVIAEGIETDAHRRHLQRLHCPCGQGYHFATPLQANVIRTWLQDYGRGR